MASHLVHDGRLVALCTPVGDIVELLLTIYKAVRFFLDKMRALGQFMATLKAAVTSVARGTHDDLWWAGAQVYNAVVASVPLLLGFIATLLGLGDVGKPVRAALAALTAPLQRIEAKLVALVVSKGQALAATLHGKGSAAPGHTPVSGHGTDPAHDAQVHAGVQALINADKPYAQIGIEKSQAEHIAATVKAAHPVFKSITVVDSGERWDYEYVASSGRVTGPPKREAQLTKIRAAFGTKLFSRKDVEHQLGVASTQANNLITHWRNENALFVLASSVSDVGTMYSFDKAKAGQREISEGNREKYGYRNPSKKSVEGLIILSKGLRPDSPAPIEKQSVTYHEEKARYDSKKPGSMYKDFGFDVAILGHKDELGASKHWNAIGHKHTRAQNQQWNKNPDNYQGPEHEKESSASGSASERYIVPNMDIGSNPEWL